MRKSTLIGILAATFLAAAAVGALTAPRAAEAGGPCMYDPGSKTYKSCAAASMGKCNHYTSTCAPSCWFDASSGQHKQCAAPSMGKCNHYTSTCEPGCMYDPGSKTYKQCAAPSMGKCNHYTSACTP